MARVLCSLRVVSRIFSVPSGSCSATMPITLRVPISSAKRCFFFSAVFLEVFAVSAAFFAGGLRVEPFFGPRFFGADSAGASCSAKSRDVALSSTVAAACAASFFLVRRVRFGASVFSIAIVSIPSKCYRVHVPSIIYVFAGNCKFPLFMHNFSDVTNFCRIFFFLSRI